MAKAKEFMGKKIKVTDNVFVMARLSEYRDEMRLDIREYVKTDKYTGPTKKGVNLPATAIDELIESLVALKEKGAVALV